MSASGVLWPAASVPVHTTAPEAPLLAMTQHDPVTDVSVTVYGVLGATYVAVDDVKLVGSTDVGASDVPMWAGGGRSRPVVMGRDGRDGHATTMAMVTPTAMKMLTPAIRPARTGRAPNAEFGVSNDGDGSSFLGPTTVASKSDRRFDGAVRVVALVRFSAAERVATEARIASERSATCRRVSNVCW